MSDERRGSGRHSWGPDDTRPPERFGGPPRRPAPDGPPTWRPGPPPPVPDGPPTGYFVPDFDDEPDEDVLAAQPPTAPPARRRAPAAREPELLTHGEPAWPSPAPATDELDDADGGDSEPWPSRWRPVRRYAVVACLLAVLVPIAAFFVGWLMYDVPSPATLAAQRKQVTTLYYSDGRSELGRYTPKEGNRIEVPLADVPVHVQNAALAAEDRSFRSNPGFDVMGIGRAAWNQLTGGSGGGSTVTQQYVKVATGEDDYSLFRKYREVIIAAKLTKQNSKDQILEDYLNVIYFGRGAYGVQAASQAYFGKNVAELTPSEGALLAGVIQSPSRWDPAKDPGQANFRWNFVLDGMVAEGWISRADRAAAQFPVTVPPEQAVPGSAGDDRAHVINQALAELEERGFSRDQLAVDGGRIVTSIDPRAQRLARDAVLAELDGQPENLHSALVAVDPRTGGVLAYYGGQDATGYDLAGGPAWNPGSAFKPFTMLAALEQDIGINSVYDGDSPLEIDGTTFANNESSSYNALPLREAMTKSVNTTFVQLADDVGPAAVRDAALQAGIPDEIEGKESLVEPAVGQPALGITLGQYPVRTIDMASAFATFAGDGMRNEPFFVREYVDADDNTRYQHEPAPQRAFDPDDAERNTQLARNVTATLTQVAAASDIPLDDGRPVAAKTGTHQLGDTDSNSAAWTVGYTPSISTAVWVGDPANTAIVNASGADIMGRGVPGQIWQRFMSSYLEDSKEESFPPLKLLGGASGPAQDQVVVQRTERPAQQQTSTPPPQPSELVPAEEEPAEEPAGEPAEDSEPACLPFNCSGSEPYPPSRGPG